MTKKTVYLSGPISGLDPIAARTYFTDAKLRLIAEAAKKSPRVDEQVNVVNPMDMAGWGLSWDTYMEIAETILRSGAIDEVYMLSGWQWSEGAKIEHRIAEEEGIAILYEDGPQVPMEPFDFCCKCERRVIEKTNYYANNKIYASISKCANEDKCRNAVELYKKHTEKLKERRERPYDALGDDQGRGGYTADEAYRKEFVEKYNDQEEE